MGEAAFPALFYFNLFGAGLATALGAPLCLLKGTLGRSHRVAGALLLVAALSGALITVEHATRGPEAVWLEMAEFVLGFLVGPLLLAFVRTEMSRDGSSFVPTPAELLPAALCLAYAAATLTGVVAWSMRVEWMMVHQATYPAISPAVLVRAVRERRDRSRLPVLTPAHFFVGLFLVLHVAQAVRYLFPRLPGVREIVPTTLTLGVAGLAVAGFLGAFVHAAPRRSRATGGSPSRPALSEFQARQLLDRLEALMERERPFTDPGLNLAGLARSLETHPHQLSRALNDHAGVSFNTLISRHRVEEAKRLLLDPDNERYTIEGIGQMAGFASRSTFYACFDRHVGVSPTRFRRESVQIHKDGQPRTAP